jgi:cellulose synthase/poly-beta-1,6-N-acetylglucosamine synthase-like glycosyltransferase
MIDQLAAAFGIIGMSCFAFGLISLAYLPLALAFELRRKKASWDEYPIVSVVVPAYNEAKTIGSCVRSLLASDYPQFEIILVDDGSTDSTLAEMKKLEGHPGIKIVLKKNGGKASALNQGYLFSKGEIIIFADADGIFGTDTIKRLVEAFVDDKIACCCGNDAPIGLHFNITKLQNLQAHVGTGYVRRALAYMNCLPIVSGNIGAFRRSVLDEIGLFKEGFIGEDLELTWRIHKAGYRVAFEPRALVRAEAPHTLKGLWNQRVRWARGFIQTLRIHHDLLFQKSAFGFYLPLNAIAMLIIPLLQLASIMLLPVLLIFMPRAVSMSMLDLIGWLGIGFALFVAVFAIALDRAWKDLRYLWVIPLWVPYSLFIDAVMLWAIILELAGTEAKWNKVERHGIEF